MASIDDLVDDWLRIDKDPETRREIEQLYHDGETAELEKRLLGRMTFGTAGLRARNEAGFTRMNSVTVIQASQGLADYMLEQIPDARKRGVVLGHDARRNGNKFAKYAAAAFVDRGIKVYWFNRFVHTPMVPFAVTMLHAAAGVMVTASHNPANDQGYKVYWQNGCQIIPPIDSGIAASIERNLDPRSWDLHNTEGSNPLVEDVSDRVIQAYIGRVTAFVAPQQPIDMPSFVYTPMHGVGLSFLDGVMRRVKAPSENTDEPPFRIVESQAKPDPTFATVKFPNPEEHGALDLAKRTADDTSTPLIIATDPDADRLAVAEKLSDGTWHQFTGNEVGILLASYIVSTTPALTSQHKFAMLNSTVSTAMLSTLCAAHSFHYVPTLTGFKWLGNIALSLSTQPDPTQRYTVPFAFEEALGYMIPSLLPDKDGVSAACVFLAAAARWRDEENLSPYAKMQQLYARYGFHAEANTYLISPDPATTTAVFTHIRSSGLPAHPFPPTLGNRKILRWRDLTMGFDSGAADGKPNLPVDSSSQMITCEVEGGVRFTARGSGTEPKIKLYIEAVSARDMMEAQAKAVGVREALLKDWFVPERWGLVLPA